MEKLNKKDKVKAQRVVVALNDEFNKICNEINKIEKRVVLRDRDSAIDYFKIGCIVKPLFRKDHGEGVVDDLSGRTGISVPVLYKAHGLAKHFQYDEEKFEKEVDTVLKSGKRATFNYFLGYIKGEKKVDLVGGKKHFVEDRLIKVERGIHAADELAEELTPQEHAEEVQGAVETFNESMGNAGAALLHNRANPKPQKKKRFSSAKWIKFVKSHEPPVPRDADDKSPLEFHHLILIARGNAATDLCGVVLSKRQHELYHSMGHEWFEEHYGIKFEDILWEYLEEWVSNTSYERT